MDSDPKKTRSLHLQRKEIKDGRSVTSSEIKRKSIRKKNVLVTRVSLKLCDRPSSGKERDIDECTAANRRRMENEISN